MDLDKLNLGRFAIRDRLSACAGSKHANVLLISTYELGRQPFGLGSAAAWLRQGSTNVRCLDLSRENLEPLTVQAADLVAFYIPMHTATQIAVRVAKKVRELNPSAHLCAFGLYAPTNAGYLYEIGFHTILGGEFEASLAALVQGLHDRQVGASSCNEAKPDISLQRLQFLVPDRSDLPALSKYAQLVLTDTTSRTVGYTEASRGCKHLCRHCPIVPVYQGKFRVVQPAVVLADIRGQVEAGAQHITFGDPDFFNGIKHATTLVQEFHREFPELSYDVTIKIEHLLKYAQYLPLLRETGCAFVTSAVESVDDRILRYFDKGHTRADFIEVIDLFDRCGLVLSPTFVAFTPWITLEGYADLLTTLDELDLVQNVAPIQYAIRLLIPAGSRLLELEELRGVVGEFDRQSLSYLWKHSDPRMDNLQADLQEMIAKLVSTRYDRQDIFDEVVGSVRRAGGSVFRRPIRPVPSGRPRAAIPYLNEPWFC